MLKIIKIISTIGLTIFATSCAKTDLNDHIDEGNISEGIYTSNEVGWTMEVPSGLEGVRSIGQHLSMVLTAEQAQNARNLK